MQEVCGKKPRRRRGIALLRCGNALDRNEKKRQYEANRNNRGRSEKGHDARLGCVRILRGVPHPKMSAGKQWCCPPSVNAMTSNRKQQTALAERREKFLAKYNASIQALAGIDAATEELRSLSSQRTDAEEKALQKIAERFDQREHDARVELAKNLAAAREIMPIKEISEETALTPAEQKKILSVLDNSQDSTGENTEGEHGQGTEADSSPTNQE